MDLKRSLKVEALEQRQLLDAMGVTDTDSPVLEGAAYIVPQAEIPEDCLAAEVAEESVALAGEVVAPEGYDAHDFAAVYNFLNQSNGTQTNAQILTVLAEHEVNPNDPGTWYNKFGTRYFEFADVEGTKFLTVVGGVSSGGSVSLENKGLVGELDVSGCTRLTAINIGGNQLTSLDTTGCTALTELTVSGSPLGTLDVSAHTKLLNFSAQTAI